MPSQVFISLSERVQKQVLKGTEHEGKTELDLDVFYETLAKKQKEREEQRTKDDSTKQIVSTGSKSDSSDSGQKNTLRKRKKGGESSGSSKNKDSETKDAEAKGKPEEEGKEEKDAGSDSDIDMVTIMKECRISRRISKPISTDHLSEMELMRLRAEERAYQKSVKHVVNPSGRKLQLGSDIKEMNSSIAMASSFIMSFVGAFAFGWYACQIFVIDELSIKALCGGVASFATMIIEVTLFLLRDYKQQKEKEKKERETRRREGYRDEEESSSGGRPAGSSGSGSGGGSADTKVASSDKVASTSAGETVTPSSDSDDHAGKLKADSGGKEEERDEKEKDQKENSRQEDKAGKSDEKNLHTKNLLQEPTETEMVPMKGGKQDRATELIERKTSATRAGA